MLVQHSVLAHAAIVKLAVDRDLCMHRATHVEGALRPGVCIGKGIAWLDSSLVHQFYQARAGYELWGIRHFRFNVVRFQLHRYTVHRWCVNSA